MSADAYRFAGFTVDVARARVLRGSSEIALRPKSFALLHYLVSHADRLIGKEELMATLWPRQVVTEDSLTRCVSEVRAAIGDGAQQMIKTVARRGYVFAEPVATGAETTADSAAAAAAVAITARPAARRSLPWRRGPVIGLVVAGLVAVAATAWQLAPRLQTAGSPRMTMVVLPFVNVGGDPAQGYLADSVTDDLTVALSRVHGATVIAAGTAFAFKGAAVDPKAIGRELNVRYLLQGTVLRQDAGLRITTRLVDTESARALWSDQFDVGRDELAKAQDDIVVRLASALDFALVRAESERSSRHPPANLDAEDLAMQCVAAAAVNQGESGPPSYALCERALQLDPNNTRALVRLALYHGDRVERLQSPDPAGDLTRARDWVDRALAIDPAFELAHCANAVVLAQEHKVRAAVVAAERCRQLNPSSARAYRTLATLHFFLVEPERSIEYADRGMLLSPRDPQLGGFLLFKGWALLMMRRDEEALRWLRQAAATSPDSPSILAPLASALALTGHDSEARATLARYLSLARTRTRTVAQWRSGPDANPAFDAFAERFKSGLRRAGMPEQ